MSKNNLTRFEIIDCLLKFPYIHGLNRNSLEKMKRVKLEQLLKNTFSNYHKYNWSIKENWKLYILECRSNDEF